MANLNVESNKAEIEAIIEEFRMDYNQHHFIRDQEFNQSWAHFDKRTKSLMTEFLERSCTAEFSGFLLYKELSTRHAGFLNKSMSDFNLTLDLGFLTKSRKYTFFSPKFIFYATYLSERIGYWRYSIYPIFRFFESWCQDENRHGDFFAAILKSQPKLLTTSISKLWCRFFLLSVFATMYLNDLQRSSFYATLGLDAKKFDIHVIKKTNQSAGRLFPVILNVDHPDFFKHLDRCAQANSALVAIDIKEKNHYGHVIQTVIYFFQRSFNYSIIISKLLQMIVMKPLDSKKDWNTIY